MFGYLSPCPYFIKEHLFALSSKEVRFGRHHSNDKETTSVE